MRARSPRRTTGSCSSCVTASARRPTATSRRVAAAAPARDVLDQAPAPPSRTPGRRSIEFWTDRAAAARPPPRSSKPRRRRGRRSGAQREPAVVHVRRRGRRRARARRRLGRRQPLLLVRRRRRHRCRSRSTTRGRARRSPGAPREPSPSGSAGPLHHALARRRRSGRRPHVRVGAGRSRGLAARVQRRAVELLLGRRRSPRDCCDDDDRPGSATIRSPSASALCDWANEQGGHDNVTVALAHLTPTPSDRDLSPLRPRPPHRRPPQAA